MKTKKVLVLDANERSSLAVIRSLGVIKDLKVFTGDSMPSSIGGCSKFCHGYYQYPSIRHTPIEFLDWLERIIEDESFDFIFPCTEISSQLLLLHPDKLTSANIPFASYNIVLSLANKGKLTSLAQKINVRCPESYYFESASEVNFDKVNSFPVVIKPCLSQLWRKDKWEYTQVQIANDKQQLRELLKQTPWLQHDSFMLQEFISGYGAGIFAIYDQGESIAFFAHKRLREKPPQGGVSVLCASNSLEPSLLKNAKKILDSVNWHGVAMVEFRVSPDGIPYLMEVNTRFWGSLQLAIDAGVDFPKLLYQITNEGKCNPVNEYNKKNQLRWLLGDLDSLYLVLKSADYSIKQKLTRLIDFFVPHFFITRHQVDRRGDWAPGLEEFKQYLNALRRK